ncbi:hypothetical protein CGI07_24350, partial [Vibrio parahaemolyticus]
MSIVFFSAFIEQLMDLALNEKTRNTKTRKANISTQAIYSITKLLNHAKHKQKYSTMPPVSLCTLARHMTICLRVIRNAWHF